MADIEKAFFMISIAEPDRNVLQFLWFDDALLDEPTMIELRFACVVFRVSSSLFLLNATVKHHSSRNHHFHFAVDDVVFGAEDEKSAYKLYMSRRRS